MTCTTGAYRLICSVSSLTFSLSCKTKDYREKPSAHLQTSPNHKNVIARNYHIILVGNFRWGSIFTDDQSYHFAGLLLMDACTHTHYNQAYFVGLIFAVRCHENCENWTFTNEAYAAAI